MNEKIKTRDSMKSIKVLDKSVNLSIKMKGSYMKVKENNEQRQEKDKYSPDQYATENLTESSEHAVRIIGQQGKKILKDSFRNGKSTSRHKKQYEGFTGSGKNPGGYASKKTRYSMKQTGKPISKIRQKPIKINKQSVKIAAKTTKKTSQATIKAAKVSVKSAKTAIQTTRAAARNTAKLVKIAYKAAIASVKTIIAASKSLFALIATGCWVAVVIIILIAMAGMMVSLLG